MNQAPVARTARILGISKSHGHFDIATFLYILVRRHAGCCIAYIFGECDRAICVHMIQQVSTRMMDWQCFRETYYCKGERGGKMVG